jgi:serine/threonine protein kinase
MPGDVGDTLVGLVRDSGLLSAAQLLELEDLRTRYPTSSDLLHKIIQRGWLTPYQAREVLQGRGRELVLGPYLLLQRLGEGGTSHVFKARQRDSGQVVALKVVRPDTGDALQARRGLRRESQAGAYLEHRNILEVYEAGQDRGTHFLIMEYVEGKDLARLVHEHGPLPAGRACDYARQAGLGLQHAFALGMVHRDVKPANLLLTAPGAVIKLLDLGLSCFVGSQAGQPDAAVVMGTPDYLAPERARDPIHADIRSDIYSLGCTLYHLLAGRPPFPGGTAEDKLRRHRAEEPEPIERLRPDLPDGLPAVVRKMMAREPEARYQTPAEAARALKPFAQPGDCEDSFVIATDEEGLSGLDPGQSTVRLPPS